MNAECVVHEDDHLTTDGRPLARPGRPEILLVDDDPCVLAVLDLALRRRGFTVHAARDGREALALYHPSRGRAWLVLMDVQMPNLDGPQTLTALRQLDPGVGVVFMTGFSGQYTTEDLLTMGAIQVLSKPLLHLNDLADALWRLTDASLSGEGAT